MKYFRYPQNFTLMIGVKFNFQLLICFESQILNFGGTMRVEIHGWSYWSDEKCPNTEFFLVHIFKHLDWLWRDTPYISVFSANEGKYRPEKTPYLDTFHTVFD